ncbi:hypothetical protein B4168_2668 [Anoxybacillus flavithermus]|nr:hypothetical protein B4168_2668 [Anoxybacillus flavithermus]OAO87432.1 hypothetical protein GT23_1081 [Parageobacillus thermoglucosidasius]
MVHELIRYRKFVCQRICDHLQKYIKRYGADMFDCGMEKVVILAMNIPRIYI